MPDVIESIGDFEAPPSGSATATARDLLWEAWAHLHTGVRVERDKLATGVDADDTSIVDTYARGGIKAGAVLDLDLERMHVWSNSGNTSVVQRGEFGSEAAAHAAGTIIHVNAEFAPFEIFRQMNNELRSLSAPNKLRGARLTVDLTWSPSLFGYDLTGVENVDSIERVLAAVPGSSLEWEPITDWRVERNLDTDVFASGFALFTDRGYSGQTVRVVYRVPFGALSSLDDDVETTTGLPNRAFDILALGAAIRCATPTEIDRNQTGSQGSGRRSQEVPAGARANAVRLPLQVYRDRVSEEQDRARNPTYLVRRY